MNTIISEKEYKKILEHVPIACVDLVIAHKNKVLLVLRNKSPAKGNWWLVGGRVLKGESLEDAAARKALEEVGLKVSIERKIGFYDTIFEDGPFPDLKTGVHTINVCFLARCVDEEPQIKIDKTSDHFKWIDKIDSSLHSYPQKVLNDAGVFRHEK